MRMRGPSFKGLIMKELRKELNKQQKNKGHEGKATSGCLVVFCVLGGAISAAIMGFRFF